MTARKITLYGAILVATVAVLAWSQELDTALFRENRKQSTILDQLENPAERKAFRVLYQQREPRKKRRLAQEFLEAYPRSWLLPHVLEIASKASIDLDDFAAALAMVRMYARGSWRR